jgi:hypothetical protein
MRRNILKAAGSRPSYETGILQRAERVCVVSLENEHIGSVAKSLVFAFDRAFFGCWWRGNSASGVIR